MLTVIMLNEFLITDYIKIIVGRVVFYVVCKRHFSFETKLNKTELNSLIYTVWPSVVDFTLLHVIFQRCENSVKVTRIKNVSYT